MPNGRYWSRRASGDGRAGRAAACTSGWPGDRAACCDSWPDGRNGRRPGASAPRWSGRAETVGAAACGYDAGKKLKGRKRHVVVDTLGLSLCVMVTPRRCKTVMARIRCRHCRGNSLMPTST
ncbi:transposase [Nonomuraea maheshkhaliensis]|uniref:transposase n=1 Tax=Nonomuraea maheshkhaliensis TaxID=419590 RepID=UPI003D1585C7